MVSRSRQRFFLIQTADTINNSVTIYTAQTKIYTYWFYGNHLLLGLVYGLNLAASRVVNGTSLHRMDIDRV